MPRLQSVEHEVPIYLSSSDRDSLEYERLQDELSLRKNNIDKLKLQYDKDLRYLDFQDQIKALQLSELKAKLGDQKRLLNI